MEKIDIRKRIREYIEIVEFLKRTGMHKSLDDLNITEDYLYITRERLYSLMEQPPYGTYDTTKNKLQIWKRLAWIEAPENRLTTQLRIGGRRVQRVKINRRIEETLLQLGGRNYVEEGRTNAGGNE